MKKRSSKSIVNRKARYSYDIIKKYTAGIKLLGEEVKSLRSGGGNLSSSYIKTADNDLYLINFNIPKYSKSGSFEYDPIRDRKLLLNRQEINQIKASLNEKGRTAVPLKVFFKQNLVKVSIAVAKGKSKQQKKQALKEKQIDRDIERQLKERY